MTENPADKDAGEPEVPISGERLRGCLESATRWAGELPGYADRNQLKADFWAICAGILASSTGLAIFPVFSQSSGLPGKTIVSAVALASAICALVPRVKGYGEQAGAARVLAAQFGSVYGRLLDLVEDESNDQQVTNQHTAKAVVAEYQSILEKKDALRELTTWRQKRQQAKSRSFGRSASHDSSGEESSDTVGLARG
jgi:hypothetical protein